MECKVFEVIDDGGSGLYSVIRAVPSSSRELLTFSAAGLGRGTADRGKKIVVSVLKKYWSNSVSPDFFEAQIEHRLKIICQRRWADLQSGDAIDIQYVMGRRVAPRKSRGESYREALMKESLENANKRDKKELSSRDKWRNRTRLRRNSSKSN